MICRGCEVGAYWGYAHAIPPLSIAGYTCLSVFVFGDKLVCDVSF